MRNSNPSRGRNGPVRPRGPFARARTGINAHFRRSLITGSLLLVPIALTYLILKFIFDVVDGVLSPGIQLVLERWFGVQWAIPGAGLVLTVVLVYIAGFAVANTLGYRAVGMIQKAMLRVPLIGAIYSASRKLVESFSPANGETGFKRVVMLQYPREGYWAIGFLTAIIVSGGMPYAVVYIPTAPLPNSGWITVVSASEVYDTDLSVQDAMQFVFSGGIVAPTEVKTRKLEEEEEGAWLRTPER